MGCAKCNDKQKNLQYEKTKEAAKLMLKECDKGCSYAWIYSINGKTYDFCSEYSNIPLEAVWVEHLSIGV